MEGNAFYVTWRDANRKEEKAAANQPKATGHSHSDFAGIPAAIHKEAPSIQQQQQQQKITRWKAPSREYRRTLQSETGSINKWAE